MHHAYASRSSRSTPSRSTHAMIGSDPDEEDINPTARERGGGGDEEEVLGWL